MEGVSCVLDKADIVHIPMPFNLSPLHSYVYLSGARAIHHTQVDEIIPYGKVTGSIKNTLSVTKGVVGEVFFTVTIIMLLIKVFQTSCRFLITCGSIF